MEIPPQEAPPGPGADADADADAEEAPAGAGSPGAASPPADGRLKAAAKRVTFPSDEDIVSGAVEPKDPWRHGSYGEGRPRVRAGGRGDRPGGARQAAPPGDPRRSELRPGRESWGDAKDWVLEPRPPGALGGRQPALALAGGPALGGEPVPSPGGKGKCLGPRRGDSEAAGLHTARQRVAWPLLSWLEGGRGINADCGEREREVGNPSDWEKRVGGSRQKSLGRGGQFAWGRGINSTAKFSSSSSSRT